MGSDDYADPDKYTEPPVLPKRNDVEKDEDEDEDYVGQGTPDATTGNRSIDYCTLQPPSTSQEEELETSENTDYFTLEPPKPSDDYVDVDASSVDDANREETSSDCVDVPKDVDDDKDRRNGQSNDYVDVDTKE